MAGTPKGTLDPGFTQGMACPVCGRDALLVRHLERYPDFVTCTNCESAFVAEDGGERVMYGKIPPSYPNTSRFALNEWVWPEAIERRARAERPSAPGAASAPPPQPPQEPAAPAPARPPEVEPPPRQPEPPAEDQDWEPSGTTPLGDEEPFQDGTSLGQVTPFPEDEPTIEPAEPDHEPDAAPPPVEQRPEPTAVEPPAEEAEPAPPLPSQPEGQHGAEQDAEDLLSALWAAGEGGEAPETEAAAPEPEEPALPDDWIPMDEPQAAASPGADPFDRDLPLEPEQDSEYPEWLSLADEIDEMVAPFEEEESEESHEPERDEISAPPDEMDAAGKAAVEEELAQAYWAGTTSEPTEIAEAPAPETEMEVEAPVAGEGAPDSAAPSPAYEPEPGQRFRVVLKGVQVRFPRRHCAHCYRSPAMKNISVLASLQRSTAPQREMTALRIPVCDSCNARANAVSEGAQTARFQAHMLGALVALTLVVCSLIFRITDFQDGILADLVALVVIASLGYVIPMVLMMLRASQMPKPPDAQFVESTLRVPGDTEGMESAFEWRNKMYAQEFLEANQPIAVSKVTRLEERAPAQPES